MTLELLATGRARFVGDLPLPTGCLFAHPATSPHAHARFTRVDASAALATPGVVAVLVAADVPGENDVGNLVHDDPLLADAEVDCVGQPFALVVAISSEIARRAADVVTADWVLLPAVLDLRAAAAAGSLIQPPQTLARGDVDAAWARCRAVVSGQVNLGSAEHAYLETQCALVVPTDAGGLVVHSGTQSPSVVQATVARCCRLPMRSVEVDVPRIGGGFGGKEDQATLWACLAALAASRLGRAVRVWPRRADDMRITGKRHPYQADFRLGLDAEGRFLAYETTLYQDAGCTTDLSPPILDRSLYHAANAYAIENVRVTGISCRTNLPSNTAFRGFGAPQGIFTIEAAIRAAARELDLPVEELQRRNLLSEGDRLPYGQPVENARGLATWERLEQVRPPARVRAEIDAWNSEGPRVRRGMAVVPVCFGIAFTATLLNQAEALVHVYTDGSVAITTGAVEMGQRVSDKIRTVAARTLGISAGQISVTSTNTLRVANVSPTAASTGADLNGAATREACLAILASVRPVAEELGLAVGELGPAAWRNLVQAAYARRRSLSALAHYATPGVVVDPVTHSGHPFAYHVFGAALVEASVDTLLGVGRVEHVTLVHDCGTSLDERIDRGQIEGALIQGIGWMTSEEIRHGPDGRLLTDSLATYKVPDLPSAPSIEVHLLGESNPIGLLNSKAVGEPPLIYGLGAFFALQDAIAAYAPSAGSSFAAPLTSEAIFGLLHPAP